MTNETARTVVQDVISARFGNPVVPTQCLQRLGFLEVFDGFLNGSGSLLCAVSNFDLRQFHDLAFEVAEAVFKVRNKALWVGAQLVRLNKHVSVECIHACRHFFGCLLRRDIS